MMKPVRPARRHIFACTGFAPLALLLAGCGLAGNPEPPTLWLPTPVKDLTATRVNDEVHLHWTMPKTTTDKVALKGDQRGHLCWMPAAETDKHPFNPKACHDAGDGVFAPGKPADFTAKLPPELTSSSPHAVAFYLELQNHAGKTAGPSNAAWVLSGTAPSPVAGLHLEASAQGVVLRWQSAPAQPGLTMRLHRSLNENAAPKAPDSSKSDQSKGATPPAEQTLEVDLDAADPGGAVDHDAPLDHTYKYWAERVLKVQSGNHALEAAGRPSESVNIDAKDVFPPAVPAGLAVVADSQAKAMDLSWTPDADADIAGYIVYRRDVTAGGALAPITEKTIVPPSFSDGTVTAGHRYAYAVSAVDQDGNESQKSPEVEEELPQ